MQIWFLSYYKGNTVIEKQNTFLNLSIYLQIIYTFIFNLASKDRKIFDEQTK